MTERLSGERLAELETEARYRANPPGGYLSKCDQDRWHEMGPSPRELRALVDEVKRLRAELAELRQAEADWEAHDARECPGFQHCDVHCPGVTL